MIGCFKYLRDTGFFYGGKQQIRASLTLLYGKFLDQDFHWHVSSFPRSHHTISKLCIYFEKCADKRSVLAAVYIRSQSYCCHSFKGPVLAEHKDNIEGRMDNL